MVEKIVHLNALDLDVSVPENVFYFDDGYVENLEKWVEDLDRRYNSNIIENKRNPLEVGLIVAYRGKIFSEEKICYHICCLNSNLSEHSKLGIRGHEETHFLDEVGRLHFLEKRMLQRIGLNFNFDEIKNSLEDSYARKETTAYIGHLFSVHQRYGFSIAKKCSTHDGDNHMPLAWRIYQQAYQDSLRESRRATRKGLKRILNMFD